jgi:hypothetical protein
MRDDYPVSSHAKVETRRDIYTENILPLYNKYATVFHYYKSIGAIPNMR